MTTGNRTVLAQQALDASDVIHMTFAKRRFGSEVPRRLEVKLPEGPSTQGGRKARQSVTLVPEGGGSVSVMCGWLDVARRQAELRSYEAVAAQFEQRCGRPFDVPPGEYGDLMQDLERTLRNLQIQTRFAEGPGIRAAVVRRSGGAPAKQRAVLAAVGVGVAIGIAVAALTLLRG